MRKALYIIGVGAFCLHATAQAKPSAAIPSTAPTQSVSDLPSAHPPLQPPGQSGEGHVTWNGAVLTVDGNGDALPDIVRQIARITGMKITGGIPEERVFGKYGPGPVQEIMGHLFDGIAINMLLVNGSQTIPKELVLTARSGAASAPNLRAVGASGDNRPTLRGNPLLPAMSQQEDTPPPPVGAPTSGDDAPGPRTEGNDNPNENNPAGQAEEQQPQSGSRTPEQIFEELRRRQQEQQKQ